MQMTPVTDLSALDSDAAFAVLSRDLQSNVSVGFFHETEAYRAVFEACAESRHLKHTSTRQNAGGLKAAIVQFEASVSPEFLVIETSLVGAELDSRLEELANVCATHSRLILIGPQNDVNLYRGLIRRGVSEYLILPVTARQVIRCIYDLHGAVGAAPTGRLVAVLGACGGAGASSIALNMAWMAGRARQAPVCLVDLDVGFGSSDVALGLKQHEGVREALQAGRKLDQQLLERLLQKYDRNLSVLTCGMPKVDATWTAEDYTTLLSVLRGSVGTAVLDLPHIGTPGLDAVLDQVDAVVVVAPPDLLGLKNTKHILSHLKRARAHDAECTVVLNKVAMSRSHELSSAEFRTGLGLGKVVTIRFDPAAFMEAVNTGHVLAASGKGKSLCADLEAVVTETLLPQRNGTGGRKSGGLLRPLLRRWSR